ncbi:M23 family metallopeptidase [Pollutimonas harenae]|uniref:M23 family metallopeptidase n=1 Tax=Pollutimonas harenae TaxID=657015 RepID=A0A853H2M3_9BURK|nr:M23 family metallopeptidase [Pollutimonas harenae]NYT86270.1 M23 family metallopeptidase [Pollutimonas harenae]TEA69969.1 M23 family peptidase [Pollutimonas harenae]
MALLVVCAMGASAMAGAWVQSQRSVRPVLSAQQERVISEQVLRDSAYVRQNVNQLASKVGDLQAKIIAMGGLSKRVAEVAGVSYTDPEVQATIEQASMAPVMDDITSEYGASWSAEGLGRELDMMTQQLSEQKDWFAMLDLVLTKRTGVEASLPTYTPVNYPYLSSSFGWRRNPVTGRHTMHEGLDFAAPKGTPIHAASGGVVTQARYASGYGKLIEISHGNGLVTRYAHASSFNVKVGDLVEKGQLIGRVGSTGRSTGSHLHFEVRMAGHPLDPTLFLARQQEPKQLVTDASGATQAVTAKVR